MGGGGGRVAGRIFFILSLPAWGGRPTASLLFTPEEKKKDKKDDRACDSLFFRLDAQKCMGWKKKHGQRRHPLPRP